jgi:hypothetical protein
MGKKASDFNRLVNSQSQKRLADTIGRSFTGAGIIALGYNYAKNGHVEVTGKRPTDAKEQKLWEAQGKRNYSIKIGDKWFSYDWAQPVAIPLAVGVDIYNSIQRTDAKIEKAIADLEKESAKSNPVKQAEIKKEIDALKDGAFAKAVEEGLLSGTQTLFDQSFVQGLTRLFGGKSIPKNIYESVLGTATQFVPALGSQASQSADQYKRRVDYGGVSGVMNQIKSKTPLRQTLPIKLDMTGEKMKESTGKMSPQKFAEAFISPSIVSRDTNTPVLKEIERLAKVTNNKNVIPYKVPADADTPDKEAKFTKYFGPLVNKELAKLIQLPQYKLASNVEKAKMFTLVIGYVYEAAKQSLYE